MSYCVISSHLNFSELFPEIKEQKTFSYTLQHAILQCGEALKQILQSFDVNWINTSSYSKVQRGHELLHSIRIIMRTQPTNITSLPLDEYSALAVLLLTDKQHPSNINCWLTEHKSLWIDQLSKFDDFFVDLIITHNWLLGLSESVYIEYAPIGQYVINLIQRTDQYDYRLYENMNGDGLPFGKNLVTQIRQRIYYKNKVRQNKHWVDYQVNKDRLYDTFQGDTKLRTAFIKAIDNLIPESEAIYGYKAFYKRNGQLNCLNYNFDLTGINQESFVLPCASGFHFCPDRRDIINYYDVSSPDVEVYQVKGWGVVIEDGDKIVCSHLQILDIWEPSTVNGLFKTNAQF